MLNALFKVRRSTTYHIRPGYIPPSLFHVALPAVCSRPSLPSSVRPDPTAPHCHTDQQRSPPRSTPSTPVWCVRYNYAMMLSGNISSNRLAMLSSTFPSVFLIPKSCPESFHRYGRRLTHSLSLCLAYSADVSAWSLPWYCGRIPDSAYMLILLCRCGAMSASSGVHGWPAMVVCTRSTTGHSAVLVRSLLLFRQRTYHCKRSHTAVASPTDPVAYHLRYDLSISPAGRCEHRCFSSFGCINPPHPEVAAKVSLWNELVRP